MSAMRISPLCAQRAALRLLVSSQCVSSRFIYTLIGQQGYHCSPYHSGAAASHSGGVELAPWIGSQGFGLAMAANYSCRRVTPKMIVSTSCETAPPLDRFHTVDCTFRRPVLSAARVFGCDVLPVIAGFAGIYQAC